MALSLPISSSPLRELFDIADLVDYKRLPTFREALSRSRTYLADEPAARSVTAICVRADGEFWLIRVGRRGGWKRLWNFGRRI